MFESYQINIENIIWSKGPIKNLYSQKNTNDKTSEIEIIEIIKNSVNIVWIRLGSSKEINDLDLFSKNINKLNNPVILITTDGDRLVPSSYDSTIINNILINKNIISWYTQNYDRTIINSKLKNFPIGLDLHTKKWLVNNNSKDKLKFMIESRKESPTKIRFSKKILSDTHNSKSHPDRIELYKTLIKNPNVVFTKDRLTFLDITKEYNKYNFALSPKGKGLDCHRTWELFLAGVIVITKSSQLDEMYKNKELPIVIINSWDELNNNLENKLESWYNQYSKFTSLENILPKLLFDYWLN